PLRTEIRVPDDRRAASGGGAELLAVRVGASEAAVIRAVAFPNARDEERHRLWRTAASGLLRQHEIRAGCERNRESGDVRDQLFHGLSPRPRILSPGPGVRRITDASCRENGTAAAS